jgi:hypothetical protein
MRRLVFAALAVLTAGGAIYLREKSSASSFSSYSDAQLDTLEANYRAVTRARVVTSPGARRDAALDAEISLERLQTERYRRIALRSLALVALLSVAGAVLAGRGRPRRDRKEDARLHEAMGDPATQLEGERNKAARLLGVTPEAPPAVVDAALAAKLAAHDLGRLDGIAPEVRQLLLDQRASLHRARDLLVRGTVRRSGPPPQQ